VADKTGNEYDKFGAGGKKLNNGRLTVIAGPPAGDPRPRCRCAGCTIEDRSAPPVAPAGRRAWHPANAGDGGDALSVGPPLLCRRAQILRAILVRCDALRGGRPRGRAVVSKERVRVAGTRHRNSLCANAGQGSANHAGKKRCHADERERFGLDVQCGERQVAEDTEEQTELRSQHQQRRKQPARRPGCVRHCPEGESDHKAQRNESKNFRTGQRTLGDHVAATDQSRGEPRQHPDSGTDHSGADFHGATTEPIDHRDGSEQRNIVEDGQEPGDGAQGEEQRPYLGIRIRKWADMEIRRLPEKHTRHRNGSR
jgi:hypothetical protein